MLVRARSFAIPFLVLFPLLGHAQGRYVGASLSLPTVEDEAGDSVSPKNVGLRLGYDHNDHIGVEFQGQFTLLEDEFSGVDFSVQILGLYAKAGVPLSDAVTLYALGGVSNVELSAEYQGAVAEADDETGTSYGAGVDYQFATDRKLSIRYMRYLQKDELYADVSGLTIGISWLF